MSKQGLLDQIRSVQKEIAELGPLRPGSLYSHHSQCGRPGCKCAREKNPIRHGPYNYLSYSFKGKSHTEFVSKKNLPEVGEQVKNYNRLVELFEMLVELNIRLARLKEEPA